MAKVEKDIHKIMNNIIQTILTNKESREVHAVEALVENQNSFESWE